MKAGRREWIGLAVIALPCLLYSMDLTVLNLALPRLTVDLAPTSSQLLWIVDIYGFLVAGMLITMGTLGDRIGRRRLLMIGAAAFRIAALALDNVVRHAPGHDVVVDVAAASAAVDLSVCDDGAGMGDAALAAARASGRRGIADMATEADACGGVVDVAPGRNGVGTCVRFSWQSLADR